VHPATVIKHRPENFQGDPRFTLEYFALRGLGEQARLLLEASGTAYDSVFYFQGPGSDYKAHAPHGQLPLLRDAELGKDFIICQSGAIVRHIARVLGLDGADARAKAECDMLFFLSKDVKKELDNFWSDDAEKTAKLHRYLKVVDGLAPRNGAHFVGDSLTFADIAIFESIDLFHELKPSFFDAYPALTSFVKSFRQLPNVAQYLASARRLGHSINESKQNPKGWTMEGYAPTTPLNPEVYASVWAGP
jgi:glutathione S-transferase